MAHRSRVNIIILQQYSFEKTSKPAPLGIFFFFFFCRHASAPLLSRCLPEIRLLMKQNQFQCREIKGKMMLEVQDRPVILLTAVDYTFSLLKIIQVYFLTQKLLLFSQWCWWILVQGCDYSYISLTFLHSHYNIIQTSQVRVGVHICKSCTQPQAKDSIYLNSLQTNQQNKNYRKQCGLLSFCRTQMTYLSYNVCQS